MSLSMEEVEELWAEGKPIPLALAPIALWHLSEPLRPPEDLIMPSSEEDLGSEF